MEQTALFEIPIKVSSNKIYDGTHWSKRHKLKRDYLWLTSVFFKMLDPCDYKVDLSFDFYFKKNALDSSNCFYMVKILEDCLVHHGIIKDDNIAYVGSITCRSNKIKDKEILEDFCVLKIKRSEGEAGSDKVPVSRRK